MVKDTLLWVAALSGHAPLGSINDGHLGPAIHEKRTFTFQEVSMPFPCCFHAAFPLPSNCTTLRLLHYTLTDTTLFLLSATHTSRVPGTAQRQARAGECRRENRPFFLLNVRGPNFHRTICGQCSFSWALEPVFASLCLVCQTPLQSIYVSSHVSPHVPLVPPLSFPVLSFVPTCRQVHSLHNQHQF